MNTRVTAAVERALDDRQREATEEVERILAAAVRVMERVAPEPPRVSDIVAEAGSSNKAFYRYFAGKDDLILAVMERGVGIVVSYLQHQMAKESKPQDKVARWIEGTLAQVADPHLISMSRAAAGQMSAATELACGRPGDDATAARSVDRADRRAGQHRRRPRRRGGLRQHGGDHAPVCGFGRAPRRRRYRAPGAVLSARAGGRLMRAIVCRAYGAPEDLVLDRCSRARAGSRPVAGAGARRRGQLPRRAVHRRQVPDQDPAAVHTGQ